MNASAKDMATIVGEAIEIASPAERESYLARECGGDAELRRRIEQLLHDHAEAGDFLEQPAAVARTIDMPAESPIAEMPGTQIGQYKLLEQIGEGGFGVVFLAEQAQPVRRKVALKVLKPGMDTRQVIARFEAERQALAIMDHPHIAKVFDGGATPSGRPYFVMELVKGVPITEFCDQSHLTPRERLELFVPVCQAVQHAHHKGIIHRDLKPSNVLVTVHDSTPLVKVIDFGVAKALGQELTDKTVFTGFAQMIGTPLYMSPEQAGESGLDIDTRSDIYSLGVLLYELLTGTTPFDKERFKQAAYNEIRRIIREEEPPRPSTRLSDSTDSLPSISAQRHMEPAKLTKLVRGELDWIVMKCLEKDRNRRYATTNDFAADLQRYLNDEPVQACPPSASYRMRKLLRRHRVAAGVTAGFVLLLVAGAATSTYFALDAAARAKESAANAEIANRNANQARRNFQKARAAVDRMLFRVAEGKLADTPHTELLRKKLLEDAVKFHEELLTDAGDDPAVRRDAAVSKAQLAFVHFLFGRRDEAEARLREAVALLERVVRDHPEERLAGWKLAWYRGYLYYPLRDRGDRAAAEEQVRAAVELADRLYREAPGEADIEVLEVAYFHLGEWFFQNRQFDEAEGWVRKALALSRQHHHGDMEGLCLGTLGLIFEVRRRPVEARENYEEARRVFDRELALKPDYRDLIGLKAGVLNDLSRSLREDGESDRADALLAEAAGLSERMADNFPRYRYELATPIGMQQTFARYLSQRGRLAEADVWFRKAADRAASRARTGPGERESLRTAFDVQAERVRMWRAGGRQDEARAALRQLTVFLDERTADSTCSNALPDELAALHLSLAALQAEFGDNDEAGQTLRRALTQFKGLASEFPDNVVHRKALSETFAAMGLHFLAAQKPQEAACACTNGIETWPGSPRAWLVRGKAYGALLQPEKAVADFSKAIELGPNNNDLPWWYLERATAYVAMRQEDTALADLSYATERWPKIWDTWVWRGDFYFRRERWSDAISDYSNGLALNPNYWSAWYWRGVASVRLSEWDRAVHDYAKAIALQPNSASLHNELARLLATCPDQKIRDPKRAVDLARSAVEREPENGMYRNTLGVSLYRLGDYQGAVDELSRSVELREGGDAFDGFFLGMSHWHLGHQDEARKWYDKAVEWMDKNQPKNEELRRFRAESAELLGVKEK